MLNILNTDYIKYNYIILNILNTTLKKKKKSTE